MSNQGIFGSGERLKVVLALLAALALVAGLATVPAASGSGGPTAGAAKKKCKKGKKNAALAKKKCKKKKKKKGKKPAPLVRATITWTGGDADDADLDLFVFATDGKVARAGADAIPNTTMSSDATGTSGSETFTDNAKPLRTFSFGVCYQVGGSAHTPFTITYTTADGIKHTDSQDPGSSFHYDYPGGAPIPSGYCPN